MLKAALSRWVDEFLEYAPEKVSSAGRIDEEDIRLISGFADVFAGISLIGLFAIFSSITAVILQQYGLILVSTAAWGLSIPLVEKRRMAFSAIVLSGAFTIGLLAPLVTFLQSFTIIPALVGLWFYWKRFHVPISGALFVFLLLAFPIAVLLQLIEMIGGSDVLTTAAPTVILLSALCLFAIALTLDMTDPERETGRSRMAFWLHLFSGPALVWSLFSLFGIADLFLFNGFDIADNAGRSPWLVILLFLFFATISLIIDRRALLVASYSTLVFAVGRIGYAQFASDDSSSFEMANQIVGVIIFATAISGALIVIIAGGWSFLRGKILALLPEGLREKFPPVSSWSPPVTPETEPGESEPLRLVLGLNDYIASIGLSTLFVGSVFLGWWLSDWSSVVEANPSEFLGAAGWRLWGMVVVPLLFLWAAAGFFVRGRQMALTALTLATQLVFVSWAGAFLAMVQLFNSDSVETSLQTNTQVPMVTWAQLPWVIVIVLISAAMNFAFWRFNRLPLSFAFGFLMLLPLMFLDRFMQIGIEPDIIAASVPKLRLAIFGALAFAGALWWDIRDPKRETQKADTAFWMHFLAAAFVVPVTYSIIQGSAWAGIGAVGVYLLLLLIALILDRRAVLVVAIAPMMSMGLFGSDNPLIASLILFSVMLALVIFWSQMRNAIGQKIPLMGVERGTNDEQAKEG